MSERWRGQGTKNKKMWLEFLLYKRSLWCFLKSAIELSKQQRTWEVKMIFPSILLLMRCALTCVLWEDQESISGRSQPSGPSRWQSVVDHCAAGARRGAEEPKWNANTGHRSQGSLIGTQLLQGLRIPWSAAEVQEPVGHRDRVRLSLSVHLKIHGLQDKCFWALHLDQIKCADLKQLQPSVLQFLCRLM